MNPPELETPSTPQPPAVKPRRRARLLVRILVGGGIVLGLLASPLTFTSEQRQFAGALAKVDSLFDAAANSNTFSGEIEVIRATGLPKALAGFKAQVDVAAPDRLRISTTIEKQPIELGREGQRLWVLQPTKSFGVIGERGVPRFSTAPETSRDDSQMGPLDLPLDWQVRWLLPRLISFEQAGTEDLRGERCRVLHGRAQPWLGKFVRLPAGTLSAWIRESDGWPMQLGFKDGTKTDALIALSDVRLGQPIPESRWQMPELAGAKIERVALSHLTKCLRAAIDLTDSKLKPLGPATGQRRVIARHGAGSLEDHDGTRVLFLRGTPEEMGEQHGTLLKPYVRDLVNRVLYGVGVGSSFSKGRWFFDEIEEAQQRIGRFVDPRYLREMDAIAAAVSLDKEELRLANFFPELFHCSGFALMGEATAGKRIFHGRILDYMKGVGLEANAAVIVYQPDEGHSWVNVSYAGFIGTVTAMNDQQISIGEMGGKGEGNWDGKPMAQLLREVMEKAGTLDEAIEILRRGPRTCEYFYVIADGKSHDAVGIAATSDIFEVIRPGEIHSRLQKPVKDAVLLSVGERYEELVRRTQAGYGKFDADSARELMTRPVCMKSNIHSVLFAPDTLDFWVANADNVNVASHTRYTKYNLRELLTSAGN